MKAKPVNPKLVDLVTLPRVPSSDYKALPSDAAVYFVMDGGRVLYIGSTGCLRGRWIWNQHHVGRLLDSYCIPFEIAWVEFPRKTIRKLLAAYEAAYLQLHQPPLNGARSHCYHRGAIEDVITDREAFNAEQQCRWEERRKKAIHGGTRNRVAQRGWQKRREKSQHGGT